MAITVTIGVKHVRRSYRDKTATKKVFVDFFCFECVAVAFVVTKFLARFLFIYIS